MCKPASFVITKNKVFWSKNTDSHEEIIKEFELHPDGAREVNIVRVEIVPPNGDYTLPLDQWVYKTDQDLLPSWYDAKTAEKYVRRALPDWLAENVILPGQKVDVINKYIAACYGDVNKIINGGTVSEVNGGTVSKVNGGTVQYVNGGTVQEVLGGTVKYVKGGTVSEVNGGTVQYVLGGTVKYVKGGTVQEVNGGTVQYVLGGTVQYVNGGTVQEVLGGTVKYVNGGTVQEVKETGCVRLFHPDGKILKVTGPKAVVLDYTGKKIKIIKSK